MALDDVINARNDYGKYIGLARAFRENSSDSGIVDKLYDTQRLTDRERETVYENVTPYSIDRKIKDKSSEAENTLIGAVDANYEDVLDGISDRKLYETLLRLPSKKIGDDNHDERAAIHEKFTKISSELEEGSVNTYLEDLKRRSKETYELFKRISERDISAGTKGTIHGLSENYAGMINHALRNSFNDKDEKADYNAMRDYINNNVSEYNKNERDLAYKALSFALPKNSDEVRLAEAA